MLLPLLFIGLGETTGKEGKRERERENGTINRKSGGDASIPSTNSTHQLLVMIAINSQKNILQQFTIIIKIPQFK